MGVVAPGAVHPHEAGGGGKHPRRLALAAMALRLGRPHEGSVARPDPDEPVGGDHPRRRPSPSPSRRPSRPPPHGRRSGTRTSTPGESRLSAPPNPIRFPQIRSLGPGRRLEIGHQLVTNPPETPRSMKPSRQSNHSGPRGLSSSWFRPGSSWGSLLISGSKVRVLGGPPIEWCLMPKWCYESAPSILSLAGRAPSCFVPIGLHWAPMTEKAATNGRSG